MILSASNVPQKQESIEKSCHKSGVIVDKTGKINFTICSTGYQREKKLYLSVGNSVEIFLNSSNSEKSGDDRSIIISLHG